MRTDMVTVRGIEDNARLVRQNDGVDIQVHRQQRKSFFLSSEVLATKPEQVDQKMGDLCVILDGFICEEDKQELVDLVETMGKTIN